jgi:hypothetical protein
MPIHDWARVTTGAFHHFHLQWMASICKSLNSGILPAGYYAMNEQRAIGLIPDVLALERTTHGTPTGRNGETTLSAGGAVPVALADSIPQVAISDEADVYARRGRIVAVRDAEDDRIVTVIEVVSPGNKSPRHALESFVNKTCELLDAEIHMLVLDLLPPGRHDPQGIHGAIWSELTDRPFQLPTGKSRTMAAYTAGSVTRAFVEPIAVGSPLPTMPLFLSPERYVPFPLEPAYLVAFEAVPPRWRDVLTAPS